MSRFLYIYSSQNNNLSMIKILYQKSEIFLSKTKKKIQDAWNGDKVVAYEFKKNIKQVISDIESGKAFEEGQSNTNLKSTFGDLAKMAGIGAIFVLPGGSAGIITIKKFLESEKAKKLGIPNFLELSISMKTIPLNPMPSIENLGQGAFGAVRKFDVHTGIDLYCNPGDPVYAIECGEVVGIIDFTGTKTNSEWWHDTRAVLVEGSSGVFVYGEIEERNGLKIGDNIECGDLIGNVITVLKKDKGKPMTMLHLELYEHKFRETLTWELGKEKPFQLLDPTKILSEIIKNHEHVA